MKQNLLFKLVATLAMAIAMTPAVFSQALLLEPDSIDFGAVQVGLTGYTESYHELTITNPTDVDLEIQLQTVNLPEPESFQLFSPNSVTIHPIVRRIWEAVCSYRHDYREDASSLLQLWEGGYLQIEEEYLWRWQFNLIGQNPITQIEAGSEGIFVLFDCQTQRFTGHSSENGQIEPVTNIRIRAGSTATYVVAFAPRESYEVSGWISFLYGDQQVRLFVSGESEFRNNLTLSNNNLDFGNIYVGRRVVMPLDVMNASGLPMNISFDCSNSESVYLFDKKVESAHDFILATDRAIDRYVTDHGESPHLVEELQELHYLQIDEELDRQWTFSLIGSDPVTQIEAVSTHEFPYGAGHVILLGKQTGHFSGFYFHDSQEWGDNEFVGVNRVMDLRVGYHPTAIGYTDERLLIRSYQYERRDVFETYEVRLSGRGLGVRAEGEGIVPSSLTLNPAFPNPFNSTTIVSFQTPFTGAISASLVDESGREFRQFEIPASAGMRGTNGRFVLDGAALPAGAYWVKVTQDGQTSSTRVVLVK